MSKIKSGFSDFLKGDKHYPLVYGIATGLYPLLFYYNSNFTLVNSVSHFIFFIISFIIVPIAINGLIFLFYPKFSSVNSYLYTIFNVVYFSILLTICTAGYEKKKVLLLVIFIAICLALFFRKHLKKIVILQLILAIIVAPKLIPDIYKHLTHSNSWQNIDDSILNVKFKLKPNIYVIQPDGYVNFSEIKKAPYNYDNSKFENYLKNKGFKLYKEFRSNYYSTLTSNSSMFSMKHHYYSNVFNGNKELYNARNIIVGENTTLQILKSNNYKTHLYLQKPYLLLNRPNVAFDYCNIDYDDFFYLSRGYNMDKDIIGELNEMLTTSKREDNSNFFFIEKFQPGHIANSKLISEGSNKERLNYLQELKNANVWLRDIIDMITNHDNNALIIIVADHGGFVGFNYSMESIEKRNDDSLIKSVFSTILAIKWPQNFKPKFQDSLKTNINLFRILFAELSNNKQLLEALEPDDSYLFTDGNLYKQINENGEVVFEAKNN